MLFLVGNFKVLKTKTMIFSVMVKKNFFNMQFDFLNLPMYFCEYSCISNDLASEENQECKEKFIRKVRGI